MDFVEQLKSSIDIVKVVGEYVRLRRVGATGRYLGLCPFHQEKTPSFNVNQTRQFYKCFGCGAGGDALKFVMEVEGLTFPETLKLLAERNGVPMPARNEYADADSRHRAALLEMHEIAVQSFRDGLRSPQGEIARAYLAKRGVTQDIIDTFGLGYSDPTGQALTRRFSDGRFTAAQIEASGLVRKRTEGTGFYDAFRGRLMFPIHNESGKVIAFGARALQGDEQPKYLNSPETPIYKKTSTLYNLHRARDGMRKANRAILVEGYMDVIGVYAAGIREVVASCGTAITNLQVRAIHRHADTVIVNFDPDDAGANAAERAIQLLLDEGMHVRVLALGGGPDGVKLDPDEFVKRFGPEAYCAKLDSASGYFHWLADRARTKFDMRSSDGRMDALKYLMPAVQKLNDKLERAAVASDIAGYLGVEPGLILDQFKRAAAERRTPGHKENRPPRVEIPAVERILLNALLSSELTREHVLPRISSPGLAAAFMTREIFETLLQMYSSGQQVTFSGLDARLPEPARNLLHEVSSADEIGDDEACLSQAEACLRRLDIDDRKRQLDEMRAKVKAAERDGRFEEALRWMAELSRLEADAGNAFG
ncbi:MAG: DNA primase [Bryobacteraceae bacterium]